MNEAIALLREMRRNYAAQGKLVEAKAITSALDALARRTRSAQLPDPTGAGSASDAFVPPNQN